MLSDIFANHNENISVFFDIGYTGTEGMMFTVFVLQVTTMAKLCSPDTRGTMFFFGGLVGSAAILSMHGIGGYLYSHSSRSAPFEFAVSFFGVFTLLTLILGIIGKLNI